MLCVRTARDRHLAYLNPQAWASGELYRLWPPDGVCPPALAAFLNSAVAGPAAGGARAARTAAGAGR